MFKLINNLDRNYYLSFYLYAVVFTFIISRRDLRYQYIIFGFVCFFYVLSDSFQILQDSELEEECISQSLMNNDEEFKLLIRR
jgi:hypothetical protein